jgi:hypothetical protein
MGIKSKYSDYNLSETESQLRNKFQYKRYISHIWTNSYPF